MSSTHRFVLRAAVFTAGALLMALEVSAFHVIGKTFGTALRETTAVIAVFLGAMSAGYWAGGRAGDRWPQPSTLVATLLGASAACFAIPWIDAWLSPRITTSALALGTHAFAATTLLFAIPTFLLAATSPIAVRLFTTGTAESGATAGSISAISTIGSIAGSLATAFFLIDWLSSISRTVIFVGIGAALTAGITMLATLARDQHPSSRRIGAFTAAALMLVTLSAAFVRSTEIDRMLLVPLPNTRIVFAGDSPYHRVTVKDRGNNRELYFSTTAVQSRMTIRDPFGAGLAYTDAFHLPRMMRPATRRILIIGLGGGTAAKQFTRYYPDTTVDVVDVDPLVADVARRYFEVRTSERLRVHISDGRTFLKRSSERWDLIIIDAYTLNRYGDTIPAHLTTREFFESAAAHLNDGGVVFFHCAFHGSQMVPALHTTLAAVFPYVVRTRGDLFASDVPLIIDKDALQQRAREATLAHLPALPKAIAELTAEVPPRGAIILRDDYAPVDLLLRRRR